jgi:hypothetical protein
VLLSGQVIPMPQSDAFQGPPDFLIRAGGYSYDDLPSCDDCPALRSRPAVCSPCSLTEADFWAVINTPSPTARSFCSDDFIIWGSWPEFQQSLRCSSWAGIKGLFL